MDVADDPQAQERDPVTPAHLRHGGGLHVARKGVGIEAQDAHVLLPADEELVSRAYEPAVQAARLRPYRDGCCKQMRVGVEPLRLPFHRSGFVRLPAPDIMVGALRTHDHVHDFHPGTQAPRTAGIYYAVGTGAQYHLSRGGGRIDLAYPRLLHAGDSAAPERIVFRLHRYKYTSFHNRCKINDYLHSSALLSIFAAVCQQRKGNILFFPSEPRRRRTLPHFGTFIVHSLSKSETCP